jgi:hypothetical protein
MHTRFARTAFLALCIASLGGCDGEDIVAPDPLFAVTNPHDPPPPAELVTLGASLEAWPYTGVNFSGAPQDPINLVFLGDADPRQIRPILSQLEGNRSAFGFPPVFPFDCTWSDAIGGVQTSFGATEGWVGSAMQLECGSYGPLRFHLRLFRQGDVTLGAVHFELLIPGTTEHQVLSWELAEQLVTVDLVRSGLLGAAPSQTGAVNEAPTFRSIPAPIYNGVPVPLRAAIGGPTSNVTAPVGIATNGSATVLTVTGNVQPVANEDVEDLVVAYGQTVPKPFCASGPSSLVRIEGPISLKQRAQLTPGGEYTVNFTATGGVTVTPIDGTTGLPSGAPYRARIVERHAGHLNDVLQSAFSLRQQNELPPTGADRGSLHELLQVGTQGNDHYALDISC